MRFTVPQGNPAEALASEAGPDLIWWAEVDPRRERKRLIDNDFRGQNRTLAHSPVWNGR